MKKYCIILLTWIAAAPLAAQESTLLHFMRQSPQSLRSNPANLSDSVRFFLGIPVLGNINFGFKSPVAYSDAIVRTSNDSLRINPGLPDKLDKRNILNFDLDIELLSFGIRFARKNMITFSMAARGYGSFRLPNDAVTFAMVGNDPSRPLSIETDIHGAAYVETALGYSRVIDNNWKVGARVKYLVGAAGVECDNLFAGVTTASDYSSIRLTSDGIVRTALFETEGLSASDIFRNSGLGFDAGVYYKTPVPGLEVSLSFVDWGYINWDAANVTNYKSSIKNGEYEFRGLEGLDSDSFDKITDTLTSLLKFEKYAGEKFSSTLPGKIFLGASYNLTKDDKFGFLFATHALHKFRQTRFAVMYNRSVGQWLSVSAGNNFYTDQLWSPSAGLNLRLGGFQFYMVAENISSFHATGFRAVNLQFGMNVTLIKKARRVVEAAAEVL